MKPPLTGILWNFFFAASESPLLLLSAVSYPRGWRAGALPSLSSSVKAYQQLNLPSCQSGQSLTTSGHPSVILGFQIWNGEEFLL